MCVLYLGYLCNNIWISQLHKEGINPDISIHLVYCRIWQTSSSFTPSCVPYKYYHVAFPSPFLADSEWHPSHWECCHQQYWGWQERLEYHQLSQTITWHWLGNSQHLCQSFLVFLLPSPATPRNILTLTTSQTGFLGIQQTFVIGQKVAEWCRTCWRPPSIWPIFTSYFNWTWKLMKCQQPARDGRVGATDNWYICYRTEQSLLSVYKYVNLLYLIKELNTQLTLTNLHQG